MAMSHEKAEENTREYPARAADLQQEPAIPDDVIWPVGAEKPGKAIPKKKASVEKTPANDDVKTTKADAKEAAPDVVAIDPEDAKPAKKPAVKKSAKDDDDKPVEKRPAPKARAEKRPSKKS